MRTLVRLLLVAAVVLPAGLHTVQAAETADEGTAAQRVVIIGNTKFFPMYQDVILPPGGRAHRTIDVSSYTRLAILAVAESAPNDGVVEVITIFGPPAVPVPNRLSLAFEGRRTARGSTGRLGVMGPRLTVELVNRSAQPVQVSLSVSASK